MAGQKKKIKACGEKSNVERKLCKLAEFLQKSAKVTWKEDTIDIVKALKGNKL